jgi:hypothetical protein
VLPTTRLTRTPARSSPSRAYGEIGLEADVALLLPDNPSDGFKFVEKVLGGPLEVEPGFTEFLQDATLSGNVIPDEAEFLSRLRLRENGLAHSIIIESCRT